MPGSTAPGATEDADLGAVALQTAPRRPVVDMAALPRRRRVADMRFRIAGACLALAAASVLLPIAPAYDPWSWLLWGREVSRLELSTAQGPAFKPLPVAISALLAPLGSAAPALWLLVARLGALAAVVLAFLVARRLAGSAGIGTLAGACAAAGVALTEGFVVHGAVGNAEPLFVALVLAAFLRALGDRHGSALSLGALAALLRPESWPFLAVYAAWRGWCDKRLRPAVVLGAVAIPAAWLLPEWIGSGELLRSGERALASNAGAPALADHPALKSLASAYGLLFLPAAFGALATRGRAALLPALAGVTWIALVALLAEVGFSGEERYALPGAALIAVSGGVGTAALARLAARKLSGPAVLALAGAFALAVLVVGAARIERTTALAPHISHQATLAVSLPEAIAAAGGRDSLLRCGLPAVGRFRGPLLAYHLDVEKRAVRADGKPAAVTFRSRLRPGDMLEPRSHGAPRLRAKNEHWRIETACDRPPRTGR